MIKVVILDLQAFIWNADGKFLIKQPLEQSNNVWVD
jgi:hypothetical protein